MKNFISKNKFILLFLISFIVFYSTFIQNGYVGGDGVSIYYPVQKLLTEGNLNFWNNYNTQYGTYYFSLGFSDIAIKSFGEIYPMQPVSIILFYSYFISFFGNSAFYYINFVGVLFIILFSYLILKELYKEKKLQIIGTIFIGFISTLTIWSFIPQNIIPATLFLFISVYFLIKYDKTNDIKFWNLAILFLFFSIIIRIIFILFLIGYIVYLFKGNLKHILKKILLGIIILIIVLGFFPFSNIKYFGDFSFIGYLNTDYHPNPIGFNHIENYATDKSFTKINIESFYNIFNGILYYFKTNILYFSPIIILFFFGIFRYKNNNRFKLFFSLILVINLIYFSNIKMLLYGDDSNILVIAFFRYLLPITILTFLFIPIIFKKINNISILIIISLYISLFSFYGYNYNHGANFYYVKEINLQYKNYTKIAQNIIPKGSIILYPDRKVQAYFTNILFDYNWFCYDCVPPNVRYQHTIDIINNLLKDNKNIYFASYQNPYNSLTQEMENYLKERYIFEYVNGSDFKREKFNFYKIKNKE